MTTATATAEFRPRLWTPGDWNAFFGFGTNILVNMLTLTILLRFVLQMPDLIVFGRILPAMGLMMCLSTMYYAYLAYRLAKRTGRSDVCALPSGISVPHMFIVTLVIMLPIKRKNQRSNRGLGGRTGVGVLPELDLMIGVHRADDPQSDAARRSARVRSPASRSPSFPCAGTGNLRDAGDRADSPCRHRCELAGGERIPREAFRLGLVAIAVGR